MTSALNPGRFFISLHRTVCFPGSISTYLCSQSRLGTVRTTSGTPSTLNSRASWGAYTLPYAAKLRMPPPDPAIIVHEIPACPLPDADADVENDADAEEGGGDLMSCVYAM